MGKFLIHGNELHLVEKEKIHQAVAKMVDVLGLAAGSTEDFDLYKVVEAYFTDLEKREAINKLLGLPGKSEAEDEA
jgi:hypothetical protein